MRVMMFGDPVVLALFFIFGSMIGSFLNVCIFRLPRQESIIGPSSKCTHCGAKIRWYQNIPIFSYVFMLGKSACCQKPIAFRYVIVELLTGITFVSFYWIYGLDLLLVPYLIFMCCLLISTFVDFEHRIIPDEVSIGGMILGIIISPFFIDLHAASFHLTNVGNNVMLVIGGFLLVAEIGHSLIKKKKLDKEDYEFIAILATFFVLNYLAQALPMLWPLGTLYALSLQSAVQGAFIGGGVIYTMGLIGDFVFKKESMGGGDVKLMALIGAFIGWKLAIVAFFIAPFFGSVVGIIEKIRTKDSTIAYGPYLSLGALVSLFWGEWIIQYIVGGHILP